MGQFELDVVAQTDLLALDGPLTIPKAHACPQAGLRPCRVPRYAWLSASQVPIIGEMVQEPCIVWNEGCEETTSHGIALVRKPLLELAEASDEGILAFVHEYGPLSACVSTVLDEELGLAMLAEPVDAYRDFARRTGAFLDLAASLFGVEPRSVTDPRRWGKFVGYADPGQFRWPEGPWPTAMYAQRSLLCRELSRWIDAAAFTPKLLCPPGVLPFVSIGTMGFPRDLCVDPETVIDTHHELGFSDISLFPNETASAMFLGQSRWRQRSHPPMGLLGSLALYLASIVSSPGGVYRCAIPSCRAGYRPKNGRKPNPNRDSYCSPECAREGNNRKTRERLRAKRALARERQSCASQVGLAVDAPSVEYE